MIKALGIAALVAIAIWSVAAVAAMSGTVHPLAPVAVVVALKVAILYWAFQKFR